MNPHRAPHGHSSAVASTFLVSLATFTALAGCSGHPQEVLGPSGTSVEQHVTSQPSLVLAPPPPDIDRWDSPRITVWTDGWRRSQKEGGVSLGGDWIYLLDVPEQPPLTFEWSARPRTGRGEITGYRWALDLLDITDETPRSGPDDLSHWSEWSLEEQSATVGPFTSSPDSSSDHYFFVEARDNVGFLSLVVIRLTAVFAAPQDPSLARR